MESLPTWLRKPPACLVLPCPLLQIDNPNRATCFMYLGLGLGLLYLSGQIRALPEHWYVTASSLQQSVSNGVLVHHLLIFFTRGNAKACPNGSESENCTTPSGSDGIVSENLCQWKRNNPSKLDGLVQVAVTGMCRCQIARSFVRSVQI